MRQEVVMPTHLVGRGFSGRMPIEERVPMGQTVKFLCGTISTSPAHPYATHTYRS